MTFTLFTIASLKNQRPNFDRLDFSSFDFSIRRFLGHLFLDFLLNYLKYSSENKTFPRLFSFQILKTFFYFPRNMTSNYRKYSNEDLEIMARRLLEEGVIDYNKMCKFMNSLYRRKHQKYDPIGKLDSKRKASLDHYYRKQLIKLWEQK